jgi:hypothetical protein
LLARKKSAENSNVGKVVTSGCLSRIFKDTVAWRESRANGNYPAAAASKVFSEQEALQHIELCMWLGWHRAFPTPSKKDRIFSLSPKVIGELFGDFVVVTDAALDNPGAC